MKGFALVFAATTLFATAASAQVTVQALLTQPLQQQAEITGTPLVTQTVPAGTIVTNSGWLRATTGVFSNGGSISYQVASSTGALGTTCELTTAGAFQTPSFASTFSAQQNGTTLVTFSSATPIGGAVVVQGFYAPSGGPSTGTGSIACDFGADGTVEVVQAATQNPAHHSRACTLGPTQGFSLLLTHTGSLGGSIIGDYTLRLTVRFVPHADGIVTYGPPTGCRPVLHYHFLTGSSFLAVAMPPVPDFWFLAVGQSQVSLAMPLPSACPLLSSAELVVGPLSSNLVQLPFAAVQSGAHAYLQFVGLHVATWTADASLGFDVFGQ